jgi:hypothetical protein
VRVDATVQALQGKYHHKHDGAAYEGSAAGIKRRIVLITLHDVRFAINLC